MDFLIHSPNGHTTYINRSDAKKYSDERSFQLRSAIKSGRRSLGILEVYYNND